MRRLSATTELFLSLPDMEEIGIACRDVAGNSEINQRRFIWRGQVRQSKIPAAYAASGADWLLPVEKFGLTAQLQSP